MPAALIIQLLATFGPSAVALVTTLISKWESSSSVTPEEWAALVAQLKMTASDQMTAQLNAAGIPLTDPKAVALLALTKS